MRIKTTIQKLPTMLRRHVQARAQATVKAIQETAQTAKNLYASETPVDLGNMKSSWRVINSTRGATVVNDAPHAAFIEFGTRPHPVSEEGQRKIRAWVWRKISGVTEANVDSITWAIVQKIRKEGSKPKWIIKSNLPWLDRVLAARLRMAKAKR